MCDFYCSLFSVCTNGVIASLKLKKALLGLQSEKGRLNLSKHHDCDWSDETDSLVRIGAQQYRSLKKDPVVYNRCIKKATLNEKANIDRVLACLKFSEQEPEVTNPKALPLEVDETIGPSPSDLGLVFDKVLKRKASDPASPSFTKSNKDTLAGGDNVASSSGGQQ